MRKNSKTTDKTYPAIFSSVIPYKSIKLYRLIEIDYTGSITLIDPITENESIKNGYNKVFLNDKNEVIFIESYLDDQQLDYELIVENGKVVKKLLFLPSGEKDFIIVYKYRDNRIIEEKALDTSEKLIYTIYRNKSGSVFQMDIF
jgi:hypothetical protein